MVPVKTLLKRIGKTIQQWRGMNRQADSAAIGEDQLVTLTNARWNGGAIVERGGQSKLLASPLASTFVTGIYDSSIGGSLVGGTSGGGGGGGGAASGGGGGGFTGTGDGPKLYWNFGGAGTSYVLFQDEEKSGATYDDNVFEINTTVAQVTAGAGSAWASVQWNGQIWWLMASGSDGQWALFSQDPVYGQNFTQPIRRTPFISATITSPAAYMTVWRGKLYFNLKLTSGADAPITYEYDGVTLRQFDTGGVNGSGGPLVGYQDKLYVLTGDASDTMRVITIGGVGTTATMPGSSRPAGKMVEYKGALYVRANDGATQQILSTTTSTFAVARDLTAAVSATINNNLAVYNGFLYYGWGTAGPAHYRLGRYDGTTWTDVHKDFGSGNTDVAAGEPFLYKGNLCRLAVVGGAVVPAWKSSGTDTTTWTQMQDDSATGRARIDSASRNLLSFQ